MLRLALLIVPALLATASAPLSAENEISGCEAFAPQTDQINLVRTIRLPGDSSQATRVDFQRAVGAPLGDFLGKGGSLVVVDDADRTIGLVNRDTLDPEALSSEANIVTVMRESVARVDTESVATVVPTDPGAIMQGGTTLPRRSPLPSSHADLGAFLRGGNNPNGLEIGAFNGIAGADVIIGVFDGQRPAVTPIAFGAAAQLRNVRALDATVAIYFRERDKPGQIAMCNGVQIAAGLILTNLHCASPRHENHVVHFGRLHLQPDKMLRGAPVTGSVRCRAVVVSPSVGRRLDFAVLRIAGTVPAPYDAAVAPLDDGGALASDQPQSSSDLATTQVQYWLSSASTSSSKQYEKYLMRPPQCAVLRADGIDPSSTFFCNANGLVASDDIDPRGIGHTCDSEQGSSGSPLFDSEMNEVIALHRGGGELLQARNCAVPAKHIYSQLKAWRLLGG